jgi:hypothetical protein
VVIGARGQADTLVGQLQLVCGELQFAEEDGSLTLAIVEGAALTTRGSAGGEMFEALCPRDHAVVGFGGRSEEDLFALTLVCAPVSIEDTGDSFGLLVGSGATSVLPAVGGVAGGTEFGPLECGDGEIVTAARIRAMTSIRGLGLDCSRPSFTG